MAHRQEKFGQSKNTCSGCAVIVGWNDNLTSWRPVAGGYARGILDAATTGAGLSIAIDMGSSNDGDGYAMLLWL